MKNLPANAGDISPRSGKIPRGMRQLSLHATSTAAQAPQNLCSATREATAMKNLSTTTKTQRSQKKEKSWIKPMMNPDCWDLIVALQFGILLFKTELKERTPSKANGCFTW